MKTEVIYLRPERTDVTLTTYIWEKAEFPEGKKRPAILVCPGGGYFDCSYQEGAPIALRFAAMGYHAFVLTYSTYHKGHGMFPDPTKKIAPHPETAHPAPVLDIAMAFLKIRENAEAWQVDTDRIAVCGFSAGGHNAAMYATNWHRDFITKALGVDKALLRPAAAILGYPLTDYVYMKEAIEAGDADKGFFENSNTAFLGTDSPTLEQLISVSPARLVDEHTPPMFIWATAADGLVPPTHSLLMAQGLAKHHIPYTLHMFEEGDHGLSAGTQASAVALSGISPEVNDWMSMAEQWLLKRFALDLPPLNPWEAMIAAQKAKGNK